MGFDFFKKLLIRPCIAPQKINSYRSTQHYPAVLKSLLFSFANSLRSSESTTTMLLLN